ncbi:hypothetical protein N0V85_009736, partial [Neurospora sp. IMI 360204]
LVVFGKIRSPGRYFGASDRLQTRSSIPSTADPAPKTKPAICRLVAGQRRSDADHRMPVRRAYHSNDPVNPADIKDLTAASFNWLCEIYKLRAFRTSYAEIMEIIEEARAEECYDPIKDHVTIQSETPY